MTTEHCWHPAIPDDHELCCFCGSVRLRKYASLKGHGQYAPPDCTSVTYVGGEEPCIEHEPPPKKDGCPF